MPMWIRFIEDLVGFFWISRGPDRAARMGGAPSRLWCTSGEGSCPRDPSGRAGGGEPSYVPLRRMTILTVLKRIERSKSSDWFLM